MKNLLILIDYRNQFWLTTRHKQASFHIPTMVEWFTQHGYSVLTRHFSDLDFTTQNYKDWYVIYQSTEDPYLLYYSYIEDCLLALKEQGAILIPDFKYNHAHHNKVFMEYLRILTNNSTLTTISSRCFGTFSEYKKFCHSPDAFFPQVVKLSEGSGSKNVIKINASRDIDKVKRMMMHKDFIFQVKDWIKACLPKRYPNFVPQTNARRKIVVQNFIDGLTCDYKVLVFWDKFYVLQRGVRPRDFRASGSGIFEFKREISDEFLSYAKMVFHSFHVPFISMDLAKKGNQFFLIEFQFDSFGTYTLEKSPWHFMEKDGQWICVEGKENLEEQFCRSIDLYIGNHP